MTLRRKLLISLLITLLPLGALGITAFTLLRDSLLDNAADEVELRADLRAESFSQRLAVAHGELESISLWPDIAEPATNGAAETDPTVLDGPLAAVKTWWSQFREIAIVRRDGTTIRATSAGYGERLLLASTEAPALGMPELVGDRWLISFSRPIDSSGDVFVVAEVATEFLIPGGLVPVDADDVDGAGAVVAAGELKTVVAFVGDHESVAVAVVTAKAVVAGDVDLTGERTVAGSDLIVAVAVDRDQVLEPLQRLRLAIVIALVSALIVAFLLAGVLGRTMNRRITRLRDVAAAISRGDWTRRSGDRRSDELGQLSDSFDEMAEQLAIDNEHRLQIQDELSHQALHDPLTGLANRVKFLDRLEDALARSMRSGSPVAVLFCDLDNLKLVNDRLGHTAGDDLLTGVADRFRHSVRPSDTVARFGGDEFVVLCAEMASADDAEVVAERLCDALVEPFYLSGEAVSSTVSIGIAVGTGSLSSAEELVRDADSAMYRAKENGRAHYVLHSETLSDRSKRRAAMAAEAAKALEEGELRLEFQPAVELETGRLVHAEALVRWDHPDRGVVGPAELLTQFGDAKLLIELDRWVVNNALGQLSKWSDALDTEAKIHVTVNLSQTTIQSDAVQDLLDEALTFHGISPGRLSIEVSEPTLVDDPAAAAVSLDLVRELGVGLILDDFGTGHSSIDRLRRYGFGSLKIDGALVRGLDRGDDGPLMAALSLASALDMTAVAEGVERVEQVQKLLRFGCKFAQGHLFCAPIDPIGLQPWLDRLEI